MSNINYGIYGSPNDWRCLGTTPTTGSNGTLYGEQRIGAADWTNTDFNNYPPFQIGLYGSYKSYYNRGLIDINTPIDTSIAYTAMASPDLPQQNVVVLDYIHNTLADPVARTVNSSPSPFALGWYYKSGSGQAPPSWNGQLYGFDGFPSNALVFGSQGMQRVLPYATIEGNDSWGTSWGLYNPNYRLMPCVRFGVKSVILEITVKYLRNSSETTQSTLESYLNNTTEWLHEHPVIGAWCKPYFRTTTTGRYSSSESSLSQNYDYTGVQPILFRPYNLQGIDIYNFMGYIIRDGNLSGNFPIFGLAGADGGTSQIYIDTSTTTNPDQTHMSSYACIYGANKGQLVTVQGSTSARFMLQLDLSIAENVEFIMRGAAAYGLFFCKRLGNLGDAGRDSGVSERWIDSNMYCGVIASDGMTYGDYTQGEDNADNSVYSWTDSTQTPFDPANIPDTDNTKYDYETHYPAWNLVPSTCNMYVVGQTAMERLSDIIATAIAQRPDPDQLSTVDYALNNGLTNNPIDTIISVRAYAARALPYSSLVPAEPIHCGAWWNNEIQGHRLSRTSDYIDYHFRRSTQNGLVAAYGNSFLDYAPYTRAELIIPYCGTVALQAADFMNHDINVRIIVDYITGMCTAFIMRDSVAIATVSGSLGVDIPVTGLQNATLAAQRVNAVLQRDNANMNTAGALAGTVVSAVGLAASAATGNVVGAIGSGAGLVSSINRLQQSDNQLIKADYDIQHMQAPVKSIQSATPNISFRYEHACRLIIYRPVLSSDYDPEIYGHTIGFACLINGKVKQFSGLTVGTIDTAGIVATDTEKTMIQKAFASGVYL